AKVANAAPLGPGRFRRSPGLSGRWQAGDLPTHVPRRGLWKDSIPPGAAGIWTARPLGRGPQPKLFREHGSLLMMSWSSRGPIGSSPAVRPIPQGMTPTPQGVKSAPKALLLATNDLNCA